MVQMPRCLGLPLLAGLLALGLVACGGNSGEEAAKTPPMPSPQDFPSAHGKTWEQLQRELGPGPVLAPAVSDLKAGRRNRFGFGLFDRARKQIADAPAAIYLMPASGQGEVLGPYPARFESLTTQPEFRSQTVAEDPDAAKAVYVAELPIKKPGSYDAIAAVRFDDRLTSATLAGPALKVVRDDPVPEVGEKAPKIHTPTLADVGGDVAKIDTRVPPSKMHGADFADVVGKKPVVLLFATPALCQSRVCGPVNDVAAEVQQKYGDKVEFIHMEIYNDNEVEKGFRPQVLEYNLPTEPWVFIVGRDGRIASRIEGAFSVRELEAAVAKVAR
jgi:hypothetical protein